MRKGCKQTYETTACEKKQEIDIKGHIHNLYGG